MTTTRRRSNLLERAGLGRSAMPSPSGLAAATATASDPAVGGVASPASPNVAESILSLDPDFYVTLGAADGLVDRSGNGNDAVAQGGVVPGAAAPIVGDEYATDFDGANDYFSTPYLPFQTGRKLTLCGFIVPDAVNGRLIVGGSGAAPDEIAVQLTGGGIDIYSGSANVSWPNVWPSTGRLLFWSVRWDGLAATRELLLNAVNKGPSQATVVASGPLSGATFANTANTGGPGVAWATPGNAAASDNTRTTAICNPAGSETDFLDVSNLGFAIPVGAAIRGIKVEVERRSVAASGILALDGTVKIIKGGVAGSTNKAQTATAWPTSDAIFAYGGAADLWGESWTRADINAANFGFRISARTAGLGKAPAAEIDHVKVTVYYTAANNDFGAGAADDTLRIGGNAGFGTYFDGRMSHVAVFERYLSDGELGWLAGTTMGARAGRDWGLVNALPASPLVGDRCSFMADATNGIIWHFIFDGQGTYPWKYVGGPPLVVADDDARSLTNQTTYANLPTDPMSLTLPALAGDYDIEVGASIGGLVAGNGGISYAVGATAAADTWAAFHTNPTGTGNADVLKRTRHTGVAASAVIAEKARTGGNYAYFWQRRRIIVRPVRVG